MATPDKDVTASIGAGFAASAAPKKAATPKPTTPVPGTTKTSAGVPMTSGKGAPVTLAQAKSLGFDSTKGITIKDGQYVFDTSLAPTRGGFQSVGMAKPGEVQMTPYYGDVTGAYRLTQQQYAAAGATGGVMNTAALAQAMQENEVRALIASGMSEQDAIDKVSAQYGIYGIKSLSGSKPKTLGGFDAAGNPVAGGDYDANGNYVGTTSPTSNVGGLMDNPEYAALVSSLEAYGLKNIASVLEKIRTDNPSISGEGMLTLLRNDARYNKEYLTRFAGNEKLKSAGKPMLDEKTYLANEAAYEKVFTQYQLPQFVNRNKYADFIGNSIAPTEVATRVSLAYDRLLKANPGSLEAFRRFFPQLSASDLVGAMLDPAEQVPALQRKVVAAEIGGAAIEQGLNASLAAQSIQNQRYSNLQSGTIGAETIAQYGIDKEMAQAGYEKIATELPTMEKLSSIYGSTMEAYTQKEAEQEQFIGLASAKRKKQQLVAREAAQFQGQSGTSRGAFSTQYLNRQSNTGAF